MTSADIKRRNEKYAKNITKRGKVKTSVSCCDYNSVHILHMLTLNLEQGRSKVPSRSFIDRFLSIRRRWIG